MDSLDEEQIQERLAPHLAAAGIMPLGWEIVPYDDPPFDTVPVVNVFVSLEGTSATEVVAAMNKAGRLMSKAFGASVDAGYYSPEIGYEDIPAGQAMIEFGGFPFSLARSAAARPGR